VTLENDAGNRYETAASSAGCYQRDMSTETLDKCNAKFIVAVYSGG
jgi:hypothetical protein